MRPQEHLSSTSITMNTTTNQKGTCMRFDSLQAFVARFAQPSLSQKLSLRRIVAGDLLTFECFPKLPPEIRLMIWELTMQSRIISIDHGSGVDQSSSWKLIKEKRPMLLSICQESRQLVLKKYTSIFQQPLPPKQVWAYTGSPKSACLRDILKALGLPQRGTIVTMPEVITKYMNAHEDEADRYKKFGTKMPIEPVKPFWFSPKNDIILFIVPSFTWIWGRTHQLWSPKERAAASIKHIAFQLDHFEGNNLRARYRKASWTRGFFKRNGSSVPIRFKNLEGGALETVTLLLKGDHEVMNIQLDETGKLKPEEWTFELDLKSDDFKEQMGMTWSQVTWTVILGKKDGVGLWYRLGTWRCNYRLWEQDKRQLLRKHQVGVNARWHAGRINRHPRWIFTPNRKMQSVPGRRGKTFYGPSV